MRKNKFMWSAPALLLLLGPNAFAAGDGDRDKLMGSWVSQNEANSDAASAWTFERKSDAFQVRQTQGASTIADYACKADGVECEIKTLGKKTKVSMWFNGTKLVQMETQGSNVVKRRFMVLPPGDTMELEIIRVVPGGKGETIQFTRGKVSTASK